MKRIIDSYLQAWAQQASFKPLLLRGARQVGKTYAVRQLGQQFENFIELNLEKSAKGRKFFQADLDPHEISQEISHLFKQQIVPGKTLLFLDEVQAEPRAILALRYFYELMPELHVIAAGSLLDFAIESVGVPVGRVEFLHMYPLSFWEFLVALDEQFLIQAIKSQTLERPINNTTHEQLLKLVSQYLAIGGMPEVVASWIDHRQAEQCAKIQQTLIMAYRQDFNKYGKQSQLKYLDTLFHHIPLQLGKKFKYSNIEGDYRKRELAPCLDLLVTAGVVHKVFHTAAQGIPLGAQADLNEFKLLYLDVGLAQAALGLDLTEWLLDPTTQFINKGEIVEAFVGQELLIYADPAQKKQLYYWLRSERTAQAEVDYVTNIKQAIVPIEVKGGAGSTLRSMHSFLAQHPQSQFGLRFSTQNYNLYEKIYSYPLYAIFMAVQSGFKF